MHGKCEMYWRPMMYWDVLQWCFGTHNCFAVQHAYVGKKMLVYGGTKKTFTLQYNMPPTAPCDGCCVKIVQFIGTHHYQVIWIFETIIDMIIIIERKGLQYHCTIPKKVYSITVSFQKRFTLSLYHTKIDSRSSAPALIPSKWTSSWSTMPVWLRWV